MNATERLMRALAHSSHPAASNLLSRMRRCGQEDEWNGHFTCRTPGCENCRGRYIGQQRRLLTKRFAEVENHELALLSVVHGVTLDLAEIEGLFRQFKKNFRNLVAARRRERRRWNRLEAVLWLEVDAFSGEDFLNLPPDKIKQMGAMAPLGAWASGPVWVVTVHGIVAHPGLDVQEVRQQLNDAWPGEQRADLSPFYPHRSKSENISGVINYANKHQCRIHLALLAERWPVAWRADYYSSLYSWAKTFRSTRISVSSPNPFHHRRKPKQPEELHESDTGSESSALHDSDPSLSLEYNEPLPFIFSSRIEGSYINWCRNGED